MISYSTIKKIVLVFLLSMIAFLFGYLFFGSKLAKFFPPSRPQTAAMPGPPAPVMQEIQALRDRIQANPKDAAAYSQLADLYFQANKFDQAATLYEQSLKINSGDVVAKNNLALCYHLLNRDKEAFQELDSALKIAPRSQHLWLTLGVVDYKTGKIAEARAALKRAYQLNPASSVGVQAKTMLRSIQ